MAAMLCLSLFAPLAPMPALASTELTAGDIAVIARANGDNVRLRASADASSASLGSFPEGTTVLVTGGPIDGGGAMLWYPVQINGASGYIAADFLWPQSDGGSAATPAPVSTPAPAATTGWIFNTNGDGIRCRDSAGTSGVILYRFVEGESVTLTGAAANGWQPVICGGQNGFVSSNFITLTQPASATTPAATSTATNTATPANTATPTPEPMVVTAASSETGATATVTGTNGDGVRCRTSRSLSAGVITVLAEGAVVNLRSAVAGNWTEVTCANQDGWVATQYLTANSNGGSVVDAGGGSSLDGAAATVTGTNGDGLRCRDAASFNSNVILVLPENTSIILRGNQSGDWYPIYCSANKEKGWVYAQYVTIGSASSGGSSSGGSSGGTSGGSSGGTSGDSSSGGAASGFSAGDAVVVANTNGDGVRLRSQASSSASVIMVLPEGTAATVRSGSSGNWVAVTYSSYQGFVYGDYLALATAGSGVGGGTTPPPASGLQPGDHALVTQTLNFRAGPSLTSTVNAIANWGDVVLITGAPQNGFYPVQYMGQAGWMGGDYLSLTDQPVSVPNVVSGNPGSAPATTQGQAMVDYAMKYLGYPYVWATHGPNTFDCSGFTYWVVLNVLKKDIGAGTWLQISQGTPVQYGDLKPGDLVFFQNTYTWGLSHVGIYIGNGQFIHAENETTGVKISSLTSTYYASRWYGARRIAN